MPDETRRMATASDMGAATLVPPGEWQVLARHSMVGFAVRHLMVTKVQGRFRDVEGILRCDDTGVTSIDGRIAVASIDTGDPVRDARLCDADFFDADRYPTIAFTAVSDPAAPGAAATVRGTLTLRGTSRPIDLQVDTSASPLGPAVDLRIRAVAKVSRREFGLEWDSAFAAGGLVINDRVTLELDIALARREAANRTQLRAAAT